MLVVTAVPAPLAVLASVARLGILLIPRAIAVRRTVPVLILTGRGTVVRWSGSGVAVASGGVAGRRRRSSCTGRTAVGGGFLRWLFRRGLFPGNSENIYALCLVNT